MYYHSYDIPELSTETNRDSWILLDSYFSASLIITTLLYSFRVSPHYFYTISSSSGTLVLLLNLLDVKNYIIYVIIFQALGLFVFKWKTLFKYTTRYKYIFFPTFITTICSIIFYFIAVNEFSTYKYTLYHSLWHVFIFTSAGGGCLLRLKLDEKLQLQNNRENLDSI